MPQNSPSFAQMQPAPSSHFGVHAPTLWRTMPGTFASQGFAPADVALVDDALAGDALAEDDGLADVEGTGAARVLALVCPAPPQSRHNETATKGRSERTFKDRGRGLARPGGRGLFLLDRTRRC